MPTIKNTSLFATDEAAIAPQIFLANSPSHKCFGQKEHPVLGSLSAQYESR